MSDNPEKLETARHNQNVGPTRRRALFTMVGTGVSAILVDGAEAGHVHRRHGYRSRASTTQQQDFVNAVDAFNNMASTYLQYITSGQSQSPLFQLLDPNVEAFNVATDTHKASGINNVISYFYGLVYKGSDGNYHGPAFNPWPPNGILPHQGPYGPPNYNVTNKVSGYAQWQDTDGSHADKIHYTFTFNGNLLLSLHAR